MKTTLAPRTVMTVEIVDSGQGVLAVHVRFDEDLSAEVRAAASYFAVLALLNPEWRPS